MAIGEYAAGRQSPFERMLDELDGEDSPISRNGVSLGAERVWPRAGGAPFDPRPFQNEEFENLYAESDGVRDVAAPAQKPERSLTTPRLVEIQAELAAAKNLDELRRLRRRCALSAHPDLVGPEQRPQAEKLMAEVNAAIDRAIKERRLAP